MKCNPLVFKCTMKFTNTGIVWFELLSTVTPCKGGLVRIRAGPEYRKSGLTG